MKKPGSRTVRNLWMLSREYGELAGAGGVKDVVCQLAEALATNRSLKVRVVLPLYGFIEPEDHGFTLLTDPLTPEKALEFMVDMNYALEERRERCRVWTATRAGVVVYLIEAQRFTEKAGVYTYADSDAKGESWKKPGAGHYDYFAMNVLLQKSSLELMMLLDQKPDVIHCHDGHTALVPALINECSGWRAYYRDTGCLVTIHNAGLGYHQEIADLPFAHGITGLPWKTISDNRLTGKFDPLLAAGSYALVNTVSENYARELQETDADEITDWLGHALLKRRVHLEGVTNGISPEQFDPARGESLGLAASYKPGDARDKLAGKLLCKEQLLAMIATDRLESGVKRYGTLERAANEPLFTFIGRLSEQKGVDHLLVAIEDLFAIHEYGQMLILGNGSEPMESAILSLTARAGLEGRVCFLRGFSSRIARTIYAAGDFFLVPSRYEPCGLTDFIAQLFGTIPVVHHVGGLVKVVDEVTGIAYQEDSATALYEALERALRMFEDKEALRSMQLEAVRKIKKDHTWKAVKKEYLALYQRAKELRAATRSLST